jgi:hypothetical protein
MGELWARAGAAVLIVERPGYGERVETTPWYRQAYASRFTFTKQLFLIGESYSGWAAWDVIRSVDYMLSREDIDRDKILLIGSVAGGGEPAGVAAALDPRITAVVPFNYDQGHVRVHGDSPSQIAKQFSPWLVAASVAPRKFVRAFEFGWEGAEEPDYPNLWVDGMLRSEKVWGFYGASDNLAASQAYGLIRLSMERVSHCFSVGPQQREGLYPIFQKWFGISLPSAKDLAILPDSELSTNPVREEARLEELQRRRPHADLVSLPPEACAQISRRKMHEIARDMAASQLRAARERLERLTGNEQAEQLRTHLQPLLGDIQPAIMRTEVTWKKALTGSQAEAISLTVEEGIRVPMLVLTPGVGKNHSVVIAVSQEGKDRFLDNRAQELEVLLRAGIAVCLPDLRGTGETASGSDQRLAQMEFDLGRNLLGSRLKDLRSVIAYLRTRQDIDTKRIAIWGESFAPPNPRDLFVDELEFESSPHVQYRADPTGSHLALLAGLYEREVAAVAARGGLASYSSVLDDPFTYVPMEVIVHGLLKTADIADIAAVIAPRPVLLEAAVNGRNIRLDHAELEHDFELTKRIYQRMGAARNLTVRGDLGAVAAWLISSLK